MAKGGENERAQCKQWSLWWSEGLDLPRPRNDIFWRTAGSGARARVRTDTGENVFRGYGDMMAEDSIGQPLIDCCTFEFKKGYSNFSILDCIASKQKIPLLIQFLQGIEKDARDANNTPILVCHKNRKKEIIFVPFPLFSQLRDFSGNFPGNALLRIWDNRIERNYMVLSLAEFFKFANPQFFLPCNSPVFPKHI